MNIKIKVIIVVAIIAWVYSFFWVWSYTRKECANIAYRKALNAYRDGKSESRTEIDDSPYIQRSVWTTEYLSFDVRDTYFAHGSDLQTNLEILALSEGFFHGYYKDGPRAHITVDGSDEHGRCAISTAEFRIIGMRHKHL